MKTHRASLFFGCFIAGTLACFAEHTTKLKGFVDLPDYKAAIFEVKQFQTNKPNARAFVTVIMLRTGESGHATELRDEESVLTLKEVQSQTGNVRINEDGKDMVYSLEETNASTSGPMASKPGEPTIKLHNVKLNYALDLYSDFTGRTLLIEPGLDRIVISIASSVRDRAEAIAALEKALLDKGMTSIRDGEKFQLIVPTPTAKSVTPQSSSVVTNGEPLGGPVIFSPAEFGQVMALYGEIIGRKLVQSEAISFPPIFLKSRAPLTKPEVIYALDTLLRWQGLKAENIDDKHFRVVYTSAP